MHSGTAQMGAVSTGTPQQSGFLVEGAPDLTTMEGAIMHFQDPETGCWVQMRASEYAAIEGNHRFNDDGTSVWSGPWVAQTNKRVREPQ